MQLPENEPKLNEWKQSLIDAGCTINKLSPLSLQFKKNGELLFAYLNADVTAPEGYKLLPIIFLRGHAVLVVPEITDRDTGEKRFLMVQQRRIASGRINLEFPAGMLDRETDDPGKVAVKELMEETGLEIGQAHLFPLSDKPLFSSPGASDEGIVFYGAELTLSHEEFVALEGRLAGNPHENEHIEVVLKTDEEFLAENESTQALLGYHLFRSRQ